MTNCHGFLLIWEPGKSRLNIISIALTSLLLYIPSLNCTLYHLNFLSRYGGLLSRDAQYRSWLEKGRPPSFWMAGFFNPQGFLTAVQQEITRQHCKEKEAWALDSVVLHSDVTDLLNAETVKIGPKEGVYIHGLFLDGAAWSNTRTLVESAPKKLFAALPVVLVTAVTKTSKKTLLQSADYGPFGGFDCPVYKYPHRTDRYIIFTVTLPTLELKPIHWTLRGVALLCSTA